MSTMPSKAAEAQREEGGGQGVALGEAGSLRLDTDMGVAREAKRRTEEGHA